VGLKSQSNRDATRRKIDRSSDGAAGYRFELIAELPELRNERG